MEHNDLRKQDLFLVVFETMFLKITLWVFVEFVLVVVVCGV